MITELDKPPILDEPIKGIKELSSCKAPGEDGIHPEVYKYDGDELAAELTRLFKELWAEGEVPQDFKDALIIHLYKNKGDRHLCDNHRGISLLSNAGKIFARVIVKRLTTCGVLVQRPVHIGHAYRRAFQKAKDMTVATMI